MRRRLTLAAVIGTLALAGCNDNNHAPTEPRAQLDKGVPCLDTDFPLGIAEAQITALYPAGTSKKNSPLADALAKAKDISEKWSKCKVADPQSKVVAFVTDLLTEFRAGHLIGGTSPGTAELVSALINTMYSGVGFWVPNLPVNEAVTDFGIGFFTPGQPLLVKTNENDAAAFLEGDAFTETTAITIFLRPDNPFEETGHTVHPPYFEITASNLSGTHYLANGQAVVGFCFDDGVLGPPAEPTITDPAIAHLAVSEGPNPGGYELLDEATAAQYEALHLECNPFNPTNSIGLGSLFDGGLEGFASAAPRMAARYVREAAAAMFLPDRLEAMVGDRKGLGGLASSFSPFGVTDRSQSEVQLNFFQNSLEESGDPVGQTVLADSPMKWSCEVECVPDVVLESPDGAGKGGVPITASLIPTGTSTGTLDPTSTTVVTTTSGSLDVGEARFENLIITEPGTYKLQFTAPGFDPLESGEFTVTAGPVIL